MLVEMKALHREKSCLPMFQTVVAKNAVVVVVVDSSSVSHEAVESSVVAADWPRMDYQHLSVTAESTALSRDFYPFLPVLLQ